VDEAGRGPLAGPVVAAAVIVRDFSFTCRIDDSKCLSAKAREAAYEEVLSKALVGISVIDNDAIDRMNIYQASLTALAEAVRRLKVVPEAILVDGNAAPEMPGKAFPVVDGDAKSLSIACASIVAKVTRDRMMDYYDEIYPAYGFKNHKGYGTAEHLNALRRIGPCRIHRKSFDPVKRSMKREELYANASDY